MLERPDRAKGLYAMIFCLLNLISVALLFAALLVIEKILILGVLSSLLMMTTMTMMKRKIRGFCYVQTFDVAEKSF